MTSSTNLPHPRFAWKTQKYAKHRRKKKYEKMIPRKTALSTQVEFSLHHLSAKQASRSSFYEHFSSFHSVWFTISYKNASWNWSWFCVTQQCDGRGWEMRGGRSTQVRGWKYHNFTRLQFKASEAFGGLLIATSIWIIVKWTPAHFRGWNGEGEKIDASQ
jgi:uncharacterized Rmd1/YagE family protein